MRKLLTAIICTVLISGMVSAAGKRGGRSNHPPRYLPNSVDGAIVQATNAVDGRLWSAWSYRNGGEFDLALSMSTSPGVWTEPILIGLDDGLDQVHPAISIDSRGATYVAYADGAGAIRLTTLQPGGTQWSSPIEVAGSTDRLSKPSLMIVGNAVVVGFRNGDDVSLRAFPLLPAEFGNQPRSIYDGPDPTTGFTEDEDEENTTTRDEPTVSGLSANSGVSVRPAGAGTYNGED